MRYAKFSSVMVLMTGLTACASYDNGDGYVLGGATRANIAEQSIRDVNVPNSEDVQSSSGVRAANAVRALNEGRRKELPSGGAGGGESL